MRRSDLRSLSFGERSEAERRLFCDVASFSLGGLEYDIGGGGVDLDLHVARVGRRLTLRGDGMVTVRGLASAVWKRRHSSCPWRASTT